MTRRVSAPRRSTPRWDGPSSPCARWCPCWPSSSSSTSGSTARLDASPASGRAASPASTGSSSRRWSTTASTHLLANSAPLILLGTFVLAAGTRRFLLATLVIVVVSGLGRVVPDAAELPRDRRQRGHLRLARLPADAGHRRAQPVELRRRARGRPALRLAAGGAASRPTSGSPGRATCSASWAACSPRSCSGAPGARRAVAPRSPAPPTRPDGRRTRLRDRGTVLAGPRLPRPYRRSVQDQGAASVGSVRGSPAMRSGMLEVDVAIVGRRSDRALRGLLRGLPGAVDRGDRRAARAGRPGHRDVPGEGDLRRGRLPGDQGPGPGREPGRAGRAVRPRRTCSGYGPRSSAT